MHATIPTSASAMAQQQQQLRFASGDHHPHHQFGVDHGQRHRPQHRQQVLPPLPPLPPARGYYHGGYGHGHAGPTASPLPTPFGDDEYPTGLPVPHPHHQHHHVPLPQLPPSPVASMLPVFPPVHPHHHHHHHALPAPLPPPPVRTQQQFHHHHHHYHTFPPPRPAPAPIPAPAPLPRPSTSTLAPSRPSLFCLPCGAHLAEFARKWEATLESHRLLTALLCPPCRKVLHSLPVLPAGLGDDDAVHGGGPDLHRCCEKDLAINPSAYRAAFRYATALKGDAWLVDEEGVGEERQGMGVEMEWTNVFEPTTAAVTTAATTAAVGTGQLKRTDSAFSRGGHSMFSLAGDDTDPMLVDPLRSASPSTAFLARASSELFLTTAADAPLGVVVPPSPGSGNTSWLCAAVTESVANPLAASFADLAAAVAVTAVEESSSGLLAESPLDAGCDTPAAAADAPFAVAHKVYLDCAGTTTPASAPSAPTCDIGSSSLFDSPRAVVIRPFGVGLAVPSLLAPTFAAAEPALPETIEPAVLSRMPEPGVPLAVLAPAPAEPKTKLAAAVRPARRGAGARRTVGHKFPGGIPAAMCRAMTPEPTPVRVLSPEPEAEAMVVDDEPEQVKLTQLIFSPPAGLYFNPEHHQHHQHYQQPQQPQSSVPVKRITLTVPTQHQPVATPARANAYAAPVGERRMPAMKPAAAARQPASRSRSTQRPAKKVKLTLKPVSQLASALAAVDTAPRPPAAAAFIPKPLLPSAASTTLPAPRPTFFERLSGMNVPWCRFCGVTQSPNWRYGPWGKKSLCNKHGCAWAGIAGSKRVRLDLTGFLGEAMEARVFPVIQEYCWPCQRTHSTPDNPLQMCGGCQKSYHRHCSPASATLVESSTTDAAAAANAATATGAGQPAPPAHHAHSTWFCSHACSRQRLDTFYIEDEAPPQPNPLTRVSFPPPERPATRKRKRKEPATAATAAVAVVGPASGRAAPRGAAGAAV
ncbi:hypothetical protein H9P43_007327 [Blastocladiella emersonii ATCC 22665]|nr:hypothetical protein H9P43_007327 [Blastocladiella emersonii ATCC 22665]